MEEKTKIQKSDKIEPTQLMRIWSDEYNYENTVLGTFTSRTALGLYLVSILEEEVNPTISRLQNLFLKKIEINPTLEGVNN